jgi:hypothetical protein
VQFNCVQNCTKNCTEGLWDSLSEPCISLCERRLERTVLRPALLPFKIAQFTQFSHQVWRHQVKSLSLNESVASFTRNFCRILSFIKGKKAGIWGHHALCRSVPNFSHLRFTSMQLIFTKLFNKTKELKDGKTSQLWTFFTQEYENDVRANLKDVSKTTATLRRVLKCCMVDLREICLFCWYNAFIERRAINWQRCGN